MFNKFSYEINRLGDLHGKNRSTPRPAQASNMESFTAIIKD